MKFASKVMGTSRVRVSPDLNKAVWAKGVRNVPYRLRIKMSRKRDDDEDAKEKMFTLVENVAVTDFKELKTVKVVEDAE
jgi:large subunit ribosomal protein L31e